MDILGKARELESRLAQTVDRAAKRVLKSNGLAPLEIAHAIVEETERHVQPAGRGAHVFPFNRIKVFVLAATRESRSHFEAVFDSAPSLHDRIAARLRGIGCAVPDLAVKIAYLPQSRPGWITPAWHLELDRVATAPPEVEAPATARIRLTVLAGTAERPEYEFTSDRLDLGRCAEVRDHRHRLIRANHVAFVDTDAPANQSVSRRHAHVSYEPRSRQYRIHDDRSEHGTEVVRGGRTIPVPSGARGVRLQTGDEVVLGEARLRVTIDE